MRGTLIGYGPAFLSNSSIPPSFHTIDVYHLLCLLLNLSPAPNNGSTKHFANFVQPSYLARLPPGSSEVSFPVIRKSEWGGDRAIPNVSYSFQPSLSFRSFWFWASLSAPYFATEAVNVPDKGARPNQEPEQSRSIRWYPERKRRSCTSTIASWSSWNWTMGRWLR